MSFRLSNLSIRLRLNLLLVFSTLGVVALLGLALYLLATLRIGSPMYKEIIGDKELQILSEPAVLYLGDAYLVLQMLGRLSGQALDELAKGRLTTASAAGV